MELLLPRDEPMTIADLCVAIADGRIRPTIRDGVYEMRVRDLRQLRADDRHVACPSHDAPLDTGLDARSLA